MPETHPVAEFSNIHVYDGDDVALTFLFDSPFSGSPFAAPIVIWQMRKSCDVTCVVKTLRKRMEGRQIDLMNYD